MKYKYILFSFFFLISFSAIAQQYAEYADTLRVDNSVYIKSRDLSRGSTITYMCFDGNNPLKQRSGRVFFENGALIEDEYEPYITKGDDVLFFNLVGEYKDGKPYDGFFINSRALDLEWFMYDFYLEGKLVSQLYSNPYQLIKDEHDNYIDSYALQEKNTFENGILKDGVELFSPIKRGESYIQIVRYVKDGKTDHFELGLFAMHYGEFITIQPIDNGYVFDSFSKGSVKITYHESGRRIEYFLPDGDYQLVTDYSYYKFSDRKEVDDKRTMYYFRRNNELYIAQLKDARQVEPFAYFQRNEIESGTLLMLTAFFFYNYKELSVDDIRFFVNNDCWDNKDNLGMSIVSGGQRYGNCFEQGDKKNTYTLLLHNEDESREVNPERLSIKNKTIDEISSLLEAQRKGSKH